MSKADDVVWNQTTEGDLVRQLFGHFPVLHDAELDGIAISEGGQKVVMTVRFEDEDPDGEPMKLLIHLEWQGVKRFTFPLEERELLGLAVEKEGDLIATRLQTLLGEGHVLAEQFQVILDQYDPAPNDDPTWLRLGV